LQSDLAQYEVAYQELETNRNELVSACFVSFLCTQSKIVSLLLQTELQSEYSKITLYMWQQWISFVALNLV